MIVAAAVAVAVFAAVAAMITMVLCVGEESKGAYQTTAINALPKFTMQTKMEWKTRTSNKKMETTKN